MNSEDKYRDIINLPHHEPKGHPRMSQINRAAQFAPFAALTGYDEAIQETGRLTSKWVDIDETIKTEINGKLNFLSDEQNCGAEVQITYFVPDSKKEGGAYLTKTGCVSKVDINRKIVVMNDGEHINIEDIVSVDGLELDS